MGTGLVIGKIPDGVNSGSPIIGRFGIVGVVGTSPNASSAIAGENFEWFCYEEPSVVRLGIVFSLVEHCCNVEFLTEVYTLETASFGYTSGE